MIFYLILSLSFLLGLISFVSPSKSLILFSIFIVAFPNSSAFGEINYSSGIMISDGYFLGIIPYLLHKIKGGLPFNINKNFPFIFFLFLNIFLLYFLFGFYNTSKLEILLKELRPIIVFLQTFILLLFIGISKININFKIISKIALVAAITNFLWFCLGYFNYFTFSDIYFENNSNRYLDLSTYFSIYYIIHYNFLRAKNLIAKKNLFFIAFLLSIGCVLLSNSRFLVISIIASILFIRAANFKDFFRYSFVSVILILLFIQFSEIIGQERVTKSLNYQGFITQIVNRYSPALKDINQMGIREFVFGFGLGHYFEIPWFGYRDMNTHNVSMDSGYLTHFVKQGIIGIVFLIFASKALCVTKFKELTKSLHIFWLLLFIVSASFYQNVVYGALIYLALLNSFELSGLYENK